MYRFTAVEVAEAQKQYKTRYKAFRPYTPSPITVTKLGTNMTTLLATQNGQDTDDYSVDDNNKVERYLGFLKPGTKLLILGTGTGRELLIAKDLGHDVIGTTFGSRNIDYATDYLNIPPTQILECANECLPFEKETFDCVAAFQVFEHTIAPLLFLLEQGRVLKQGGILLLEWPPAATHTGGANPHHQVCFTPGQAIALFQKAGFVDIEVTLDDGSKIPENELWNGNQTKMLVIKGSKGVATQDYIRRAWNG